MVAAKLVFFSPGAASTCTVNATPVLIAFSSFVSIIFLDFDLSSLSLEYPRVRLKAVAATVSA